jgi:thiol-disulfide isomerase/thioredoxin
MKVLKIGAIWCSGCLVMKPIWKEIELENPWLETEYFEYDDNPEIMEKHSVGDTLPVFIFLDSDENEIKRIVGETSKKELLQIIDENKDK